MSKMAAHYLGSTIKQVTVEFPITPDPSDYFTLKNDDFVINVYWEYEAEGLLLTLGIIPFNPELQLSGVPILCIPEAEVLAETLENYETIDLVRYVNGEGVTIWTGSCVLMEYGRYKLEPAYRVSSEPEVFVLKLPRHGLGDIDWQLFSRDSCEPAAKLQNTITTYQRR